MVRWCVYVREGEMGVGEREALVRHKIIFPEPETSSRKQYLIRNQGIPNKKRNNTVLKFRVGNVLPFCLLLPFISQPFSSTKLFSSLRDLGRGP